MMVGGSFLRLDVDAPKDIDCVLFYRASETIDPRQLQQKCIEAVQQGVDARIIPVDADPALLVRTAMFFGFLYAIDKRSMSLSRGSILVSL
jgi:hypothetical protein